MAKDLMVLSIGVVNITTGKTMYDWSIYEDNRRVYLTSCGHLVVCAEGTELELNTEYSLKGNDTRRHLKNVQFVDSCKADNKTVVDMLFKNRYDYRVKRAFQKAAFQRKLGISYSLK